MHNPITRRKALSAVALGGSLIPSAVRSSESYSPFFPVTEDAPVITGIENFHLRIPWPKEEVEAGMLNRINMVKVTTDSGITGYATGRPIQPEDLQKVREIFIGRTPFALERHIRPYLVKCASVEHAFWDIIGKIAGMPVHKLWGGDREEIKCYLTCVWPGKPDQSDVPYQRQADHALYYKKKGFKALKMRAWRPRPLDDADAVRTIREAVGPEFDIMIDRTAARPGWVWNFETGLRMAREFEALGVKWLEEPFDLHDYLPHKKLAAMVDIPITGGELDNDVFEFARCFKEDYFDGVNADGHLCGGMSVLKKIADLAVALGKMCIPHGIHSTDLAGQLQVVAACPDIPIEEIVMVVPPLLPQEQWRPALKILNTPSLYTIRDGFIQIPQGPGLGIDYNEDAIAEYRI